MESEAIGVASTKWKKRFALSLVMLIASVGLFVFSTVAWITHLFEEEVLLEMGLVDVDIEVYFDDPIDGITPAGEVIIIVNDPEDPDDDITKPGVYLVNITENTSVIAFEDFRVKIKVKSSVSTYVRVRIIEQLTMIYTDHLGVQTELSIVNSTYMPFSFETENWYDRRSSDGYLYYMLPVTRQSESVPTVIDLIADPPVDFSTYPPGYSLQIAFSIEAVQAEGGPENVWNLATAPWGSPW